MYHSTHAYQCTESTENNWKDLRCQSQNGFQYTYYLIRINIIIFLQTVFGYVEFERQIQQYFSKWESYERERKRYRQTDRQTNKDQRRERVKGES